MNRSYGYSLNYLDHQVGIGDMSDVVKGYLYLRTPLSRSGLVTADKISHAGKVQAGHPSMASIPPPVLCRRSVSDPSSMPNPTYNTNSFMFCFYENQY